MAKRPSSVRDLRSKAGHTLDSLAEKSGVSRRTIARCEAEDRWPAYPAQRRALETALGAVK